MTGFSLPAARVALAIHYWEPRDVFEWAETLVRATPDSPVIGLLRERGRIQRGGSSLESLLDDLVAIVAPGFDLRSPAAEALAKSLLQARLEVYLAGQCQPWEVCRMIQPIETLYDFPDWLGSLYQACDWIGPASLPVDCRHLELHIREYLKKI